MPAEGEPVLYLASPSPGAVILILERCSPGYRYEQDRSLPGHLSYIISVIMHLSVVQGGA